MSLGFYVLNGSRNETSANNGISHFIEHMLFKGTANRTAKDIADEIDAVGGQLNAYTAKDYTCYYVRVLDSHFDIALDVLADMFLNPHFDDSDIEKEINVVAEEISMRDDSPEDLAHDLLQHSVWKGHPLGFDILGKIKTIKTFNSEILKSYFKQNYRPQNTVISIAGNYDAKTVVARLEKYFAGFKPDIEIKAKNRKVQYKPGIIKKEKDVEQLHLCVGFEGISHKSEDTYVLAALNTFFGGGMSSRLFQNIREKHGLVYSIYSYGTSSVDAGLFIIYAALNANSSSVVIDLILNEIKRLFDEKINEEYLYKTKQQIKSNYLLSLESSSSRMGSLGRSCLLLDKILTPDEIIQKIDEITLDNVYDLTKRIFDFNKISFSAVGDVDTIKHEMLK